MAKFIELTRIDDEKVLLKCKKINAVRYSKELEGTLVWSDKWENCVNVKESVKDIKIQFKKLKFNYKNKYIPLIK